MIRKAASKKRIAVFFLGLMTLETLIPMRGLALTSGPAQPEMTQFQPAGMSDMVDLFTGDFKYNLPLLDVDGYPVNLSYAQGAGMEDEASWVGLGWNLNVGSVTRQLKGIPDDHSGDKVTTKYHMKKKVTTGAKVSGRLEVTGWEVLRVGGSISAGLFYDNYTGYGAEVGYGYNAGLSLSSSNAGSLTVGLNSGVNSSTSSGVSKTLSASLSIGSAKNDKFINQAGVSYSQSYNTREGMKSMTLGASFGKTGLLTGSATYDLNTPVFYPSGQIPFKNASHTFSIDLGVTAYTVSLGGGFSGYRTTRVVAKNEFANEAYGAMYGANGKNNDAALMDFMREKDNIVVPDMQHIAMPIATPDNFNFSSQTGGGQFKVYNNGSAVYFNNQKIDRSNNTSFGSDLGYGALFHGGVSLYDQQVTDISQKWKEENGFLGRGDFPKPDGDLEEQSYLKSIGENTMENADFAARIDHEEPVRVPIHGRSAGSQLQRPDHTHNSVTGNLKKTGRQVRNNVIQYLTAKQATLGGLTKYIPSYPLLDSSTFSAQAACNQPFDTLTRVNAIRKGHHISEISVLGGDGKRMVYGVPVYNNLQKEISFAYKGNSPSNRISNLVNYEVENGQIVHKIQGTDEYYNEQTQPGYATSYLLSAILSPDYVDLKNDGVTEDDRGTAVKFNYSRATDKFNWRSPMSETVKTATHNKGNLADPDDDKASIVYGQKELWYLHSIETKTKIAYFITEDRKDGLGVSDIHGEINPAVKQRRLKEIRLYSKSDLNTPIKTVHMRYDYSLCAGVPNHTKEEGTGKLTLKSVHFTYGTSKLGEHHPYKFDYKGGTAGAYGELMSDRWGTFKAKTGNPGGMLNDEFPYTRNVTPDMYQLNKIELPSGGTINVEYESDAYRYVQNRQAMEMLSWHKMLDGDGYETNDLDKMKMLVVPNPAKATDLATFKERYLNGGKYLYGKVFVNVTDRPGSEELADFDWVPCYGEVTNAVTYDAEHIKVSFANKTVSGGTFNPFILAAWQRMRLEYPRYAYPGFKNGISDDKPIAAALSALTNAIGNLRELKEDFNARGARKGFARKVKMDRSFVRMGTQLKEGGGARVKTLSTKEVWDDGPEEASIMQYTYTTEGPDGNQVCSGVASYEPAVGGDENPWRLPDPYTQVNPQAINNEYYLEEPFGESFFPAPVVGYSEVKVESRSGREGAAVSQTGYLQHEFYTAKDFPTEVIATPLDRAEHKRPAAGSFFGSKSVYELTMSQGYVIRLNDMHGKSKAERVFNQQKKEIAATEYYYNSEDRGGSQRLVNKVDVVDEKGVITKNQIIGRELDMMVDMREGETSNSGTSINVGVDVIPIFWFIIPVPHFPITSNSDYRLFRSASIVKTVQYFGIPKKIVKKADGSEKTSSHLLFDKNTGAPVVTATDNEFKDPIYSLSIPAYWVHERMGQAYKSADLLLKSLSVDKNGVVNSRYGNILTPGDEMVTLNGTEGQRYWVIASTVPGEKVRIIDLRGVVVKDMTGDFKIVRSGYRNLTGAVAGSITSLEKPFSDTRLNLPANTDLTNLLVLDAKAALYSEEWGQPASCKPESCPEGWYLSKDGLRCLQPPTVHEEGIGFYNSTSQVNLMGTVYAAYAEFYDSNGFHETRNNDFWSGRNGRFQPNAIWIKSGGNDQWNMLKKKFYSHRSGEFWIGFGGDERVEVKINGGVIYSQTGQSLTTNWYAWNMRKIYLHEGYNEISFMIKNINNDYGGAFEIYDNNRDELLSGNSQIIDVLYDSHRAIEDGRPYEAFILDGNMNITSSRYRCGGGWGGPNYNTDELVPYCESSPLGECPAGYVMSADGFHCEKRVTTNFDLAIRSWFPSMPSVKYGGAMIVDESPQAYYNNQSNYFGRPIVPAGYAPHHGRLTQAAMWPNMALGTSGTMRVSFCINITEAADYWFGYSAASSMSVQLNNSEYVVVYDGDFPTYYERPEIFWQVQKVYLQPGINHISVEAKAGAFAYNCVAFEIYKGPLSHLAQLQGDEVPNTIFKLDALPHSGQIYNLGIENSSGTITHQRYSCSPNNHFNVCASDMTTCSKLKLSEAINPYRTGHLGNWLPAEEKAFLTNRKATPKGTIDVVRKGGSYARFVSFWQLDAATQTWKQSADIDWTTARWITAYDQYSQELENKNALHQYTGTRFGFNGSLPIILGTNAQSRELFADGFEDYGFSRKCAGYIPCMGDNFDIRKVVAGQFSQWLNADESHSGNYSLKLTSPVTLYTQAFTETHGPGKYLVRNANSEYQRAPVPALQLFGFNPVPDRKYILSVWMKDNAPRTKTLPIQIALEGTVLTGNWKATVEGWKLGEYEINMAIFTTAAMRQLEFKISGSATTLIDDIRIFPKDGQAVTYSYDDKTLRLMAELDANNFATFYEYDEQGRLIRVKKETEQGVLTIKESRSSYIKGNL